MKARQEKEKDGTRVKAPKRKTAVERIVQAPLYPGGLLNLENARARGGLGSDDRTVQRCLLRFGRGL